MTGRRYEHAERTPPRPLRLRDILAQHLDVDDEALAAVQAEFDAMPYGLGVVLPDGVIGSLDPPANHGWHLVDEQGRRFHLGIATTTAPYLHLAWEDDDADWWAARDGEP